MKNLNEFIQDFQSLTLNTNDKQNNPFSSYAPFVRDKKYYYIFISDMAKHTHNLRENKNCSLFFIEDEKDCSNIFARKRATLQCESNEFEKNTSEESKILGLFENKFDKKMVKMLREMKDFHIFQFKPFYGEAVFGFGKAYNLGGENFTEFIQRENTSSGHKHK